MSPLFQSVGSLSALFTVAMAGRWWRGDLQPTKGVSKELPVSRIALAADHAGFALKDELAAWLLEQGHEVSDLGTNGPDSSTLR